MRSKEVCDNRASERTQNAGLINKIAFKGKAANIKAARKMLIDPPNTSAVKRVGKIVRNKSI